MGYKGVWGRDCEMGDENQCKYVGDICATVL